MIHVLPLEYHKAVRRLKTGVAWLVLPPLICWMVGTIVRSPVLDSPRLTVFGQTFRSDDLVQTYWLACGLLLVVLVFLVHVILRPICPTCQKALLRRFFPDFFFCRQCGDCYASQTMEPVAPTVVSPTDTARVSDRSSTGARDRSGSWSTFGTIRLLPEAYHRINSGWRYIDSWLLPALGGWWISNTFGIIETVRVTTPAVFGDGVSNGHGLNTVLIVSIFLLIVLRFVKSKVLKPICPTCLTPLSHDGLRAQFVCKGCADCYDTDTMERFVSVDTPPLGSERVQDAPRKAGRNLFAPWEDFATIRVLPRDWNWFLSRCEKYCALMLGLQLVSFVGLGFTPDQFDKSVSAVFGFRVMPQMVLFMTFVVTMFGFSTWFSRFVHLVCPTCLARLDYQKAGHQWCCRTCLTGYDIPTMAVREQIGGLSTAKDSGPSPVTVRVPSAAQLKP
jgi:ribosomal protein L37AE/L43A